MGVKEFFKPNWKKIILFVLIVIAVIVVWKVITSGYYIKEGLCYSDFLENCEGKKVEVTGEIKKGPCGKSGDVREAYILNNINVQPCNLESKIHFHKDFPWVYKKKCFQTGYLYLIKYCHSEGAIIEINNAVERLLPNPENKNVKVVGEIFIEKVPSPGLSLAYGVVGIIPESITIVEG